MDKYHPPMKFSIKAFVIALSNSVFYTHRTFDTCPKATIFDKPKSRQTFGRGRKLPYTRNGYIYLDVGFPIRALISAGTSLLGPALLKKIF